MKSTIISEIEENLAFSLPSSSSSSSSSSSASASSKAKLFNDDIITSYIDRDLLITSKGLEIASIHGIDMHFSMIYEEQLKKQSRKQSNSISYSTVENVLEEQFDAFLSRLELLESEEYSSVAEDDDVDALARERILNIKLPNSAFEPLLAHLTPSRAPLHQALMQQSLISGQHQKVKKKSKSDRKDKKRREREKETRSQDQLQLGKVKNRKDKQLQNIDFYGSNTQQISPIQLPATSAREKYQDVIGAIVAKSIAEASVSSYLITVALLLRIMKQDNNIISSDSNENMNYGPVTSLPVGNLIASLFEKIEVHEFRNDPRNEYNPSVKVQNPFRKLLLKSTLTKGETVSVSFSADGGSELGESRSLLEGETASQSGYFPGAYSDAGSTVGSNLAEQGTETASVCDDDISEEELLAQALALSMSGGSKNVNVNDKTTSEVGSAIVSETASIHESILNDSNLRQSLMDIPETLPNLHPLSTWGSFCDRYFWQTIMNIHTTEHIDLLPSLSLKQVIFALIIVVAANADNALTETINSNITFDTFSGDTRDVNSEESKLNDPPSKHLIGSLQPSTPNALSFLLIEMLLDFLIKELLLHSKEPQDDQSQEFQHHRYFLIWSITMLLKILCAELNSAVASGVSPWLIGLGIAKTLDDSAMGRPFVFRLLEHVADCMGLDSSVGGKNDGLVDSALGNNIDLQAYRHTIRMIAIDTFVAGITIFKPTYDERIRLLKKLLLEAPSCHDADISDLHCSQFSCYDMDVRNVYVSIYYLYLLQKLCLGNIYATFNLKSRSKEGSRGSTEDSDDSQPNTPSEDVISVFSGGFSSDETLSPIGESSVECNLSVELLLLNRLSRHDIMINTMKGNDSMKPLFWGELVLYKAIIGHNLNNYINVYNSLSPSAQNLVFNPQRCDPQIVLSENNKTATYKATKTWATVCAGGQGLLPSSGTHKWSIKIDKCDRGHIFVGIVTADASLATYAGGDRNGWGLIGTRTLWHNKSKVKSEVGPGFGSQTVVHLNLNTDIGELSFKTDNCDWTVIFKDLPSVPFFPAISVHHREDRVSISSFITSKSQSLDEPMSMVSFEKSMRIQLPFIRSMQLLCSRTFHILSESDKCKDDLHYQLAVLSHPFIGYVLPSMAAVIASSETKCDITGLSSIQLSPYLTIVTKKLADIYTRMQKQSIRRVSNDSMVMINVEGDWIFQSSTSSNIPAQEYKIRFEHICEAVGENVGNAPDEMAGNTVVQIFGKGKSSMSSVNIDGTVSGTRLKFKESWTMGGTCVIEGRLSLCGSFFAGSFKDDKTGTVGSIEGFRMKSTKNSWNADVNYISSIILKSSLLCTMAAGKYVANLIVGLNPIVCNTQIEESTTIEPEPTGDDQGTVDDEDLRDINVIEKWANSNLFSGGLPLEQELIASLSDEIKIFLCLGRPLSETNMSNIQSIAETSDSEHNLGDLLQWWLSVVFPLLSSSKTKKVCSSKDNAEDPISTEVDSDLVQEIILNQNSGKRIDEYVLHHTGQSALSKIGGEIMQNTRRLILAALIKHSGCKCLCIAENEALSNESKSIFDRPHIVLLDVWRASQKCIEYAVRHKQKSGLPYQVICKALSTKAQLLLNIEPNVACTAVMASLENFTQDTTTSEFAQGIAETDVQQDCSKLLTATVEFLSSPLRDKEVEKLHILLKQNALKAVSRNAGLRAFLLLVNKLDVPFGDTVFQPITPLVLHSTLVRYVSAAFYGQTDIDSDNVTFQVSDVSSNGHYSGDLKGLCVSLSSRLKVSFESAYEFIAQLISKCTWSGDRDGQCIALSAWGLKILPDDHIFINRVGIFRILHTVLDDVRTSMAQEGTTQTERQSGPFSKEMKFNSNKRLAQMVLKVVHSLASQVAFSDDNTVVVSPTSALKLQKRPSGPDTLSHSLFDMLYAELYVGSRGLIFKADKGKDDINVSTDQDNNLYGEQYVYRILRLLYFVSNSNGCRASLSSPKWITLFMFVVSSGGTVLQRRVLRLIRRLLINVDPSNFRAYIPSFLVNDDMIESDVPLDDDDVNLLIDQQLLDTTPLLGAITSAERLISFFLEGISIIIPTKGVTNETLQTYMMEQSSINSLAAESLLLLRVLQGVPSWRNVIDQILHKFLHDNFSALNNTVWNNASYLRMTAACLAIFGGHIDRLRVGGMVSIRPNVNITDSLANRLVAISRSCGLLVEMSEDTVEVVFMERGATTFGNSNPTDIKSIQYTAIMPTTQNVIIGRINKRDIFASSDVPVIANFASKSVFEDCLNILTLYGIPWMIQEFREENLKPAVTSSEPIDQTNEIETSSKDEVKVNSDDEVSDINAVQLYVNTSAFREVSTILQYNDHISSLLSSSDVFQNLISLASEKCASGSLAVLELIEERWTRLWDLYSSNDMADETENDDSQSTKTPEDRVSQEDVAARQINQDVSARSMLLEAAAISGIFASFGEPRQVDPATQAAAIAQMVDIGLPREWSEVALRRCRYNVEMAINMCFEHGAEMSQIVAEDQLMQAASQRVDSNRRSGRATDSAGRGSGSPRRRGPGASADSTLVRQLLEMGFPPSWCARAMEATNNNVDAALSWILSHGEELVTDPEQQESATSSDVSSNKTLPSKNPLCTISGSSVIKEDLTCTSQDAGFPSVGCRGFGVSSGKWYYELNLCTAGCVQVGWVDSAYEGNADNGEGVGDDEHSWAFDGWRMYLWHKTSIEWGARWDKGDTVGCAIDFDEGTMSFSLNGFGPEVDMGTAFRDFSYDGSLYPCVSFNKRESVQFNFGATPFRTSPPPGYRPFIEHINAVQERNLKIKEEFYNDKYFQSLYMFTSLTANRDSEEGESSATVEDALDECKRDSNFHSSKRYFQADDSRLNSDSNVSFPNTNLSSTIPKERRAILKQFRNISKDLCVLYARMAVLRILSGFPTYSLQTRNHFLDIFDESSTLSSSDTCVMSSLLKIIRLCGASTTRTKIYLNIMSLLSSTMSHPNNLGSIFSTGGAPMLSDLQNAITCILTEFRRKNDSKLIEHFLDNIFVDLLNSTRRDISQQWVSENNFTPVIFSDYVSDSTILKQPSLVLATFLTNILLKQFASEDSPHSLEITAWMTKLLKFWNFGIRSPSMVVRLCCVRMLTLITEEISQGSHFLNSREHLVTIILDMLPRQRLEKHTLTRMIQERGSLPLCSEYLQALLEHVSVVRQAEITVMHTVDVTRTKDNLQVDSLENYVDENDPNFNWEIISGRLLSDNGIETWTGSINQIASEEIEQYDDRKSIDRERQELPPELMPGGKVCRSIKMTVPVPVQIQEVEPLASEESEDNATNTAASSNEEDSSKALSSDAAVPNEKEVITDQLGTVLEICNWDEQLIEPIGDARIVKWDDIETPEKIRWGAEGKYDATHVKLKDGKITTKYSDPVNREAKLFNSMFGIECKFGVILRILKLPPPLENDKQLFGRLVGIMELPDFNSSVFIVGAIEMDGTWTFKEKSLISGASHSSWSVRFGQSHWRPGTEYRVSSTSSSSSVIDHLNQEMSGSYEYEASSHGKTMTVKGTISFQQSRLFFFDDRYNPAGTGLIISSDKLSVGKDLRTSRSSSSQCCIYGSIGFSSGVHYWEYKIDQADSAGSIFLGVAERPPAYSRSTPKTDRWYGYGFVNNRASIRPGHSIVSDRYNVYGDLFQTGDIVGVMLDMNRGRLSFFLDGTKFGEHTIADLGEAFDNLNSSGQVSKVFYPVVGLGKSQDRVAITPRWISSIGTRVRDEISNVNKAYSLLYEWNIERPTPSRPNSSMLWLYRYAWCDWSRWVSSRYVRIRTRCKAVSICVDVSPKACIEASIRVGLSYPIFRGDRLRFSKSSGRILEAKEEAVVLGAYKGRLWYRLDGQSQQGDGNIMESASLAWSLIQNDIEGMELIRRGIIEKILPPEVMETPLPRIPTFQGGMIFLSHSGEAYLRNGLEIDTSEVLCKIPPNTVLYAIEKRVNASNITRYRVMFENKFGWISERMRGGTEDIMLSKVLNVTDEQVKEALASVIAAAEEQKLTDKIIFEDVGSISEALLHWEACIMKAGFENLLIPTGPLASKHHEVKFEDFVKLATTMDGVKVWSVEDDMQLAEVISRVAEREGVSSQNLSCISVESYLASIDAPSSSLYQINSQRALARASILRVANQIFGFALPFLSLQLPEDKMRRDYRGTDDDIEVLITNIPKSDEVIDSPSTTLSSSSSLSSPTSTKNKSMALLSCGSRRLRSLRRLIFNQTKISFWESILESTTTPTQLPQDEYEDPREIKVVKINRIKATLNRLTTIANPMERLKLSVCGQLHKEMKSWQNSSFRRSYLGKGHGGQRRGFKVKFLGEGVDDYGGPYRAVFEQIVDELQCDSLLVGKNASDRCLLPLFIPCPNRLSSVGANQDKYILSTAPASPSTQEMMHFFGKLIGTAVRHNLHLGLDLSSLLWRPLVRLVVSRAHLETVDTLTSTQLQVVIRLGVSIEQKAMNEGKGIDENSRPEEWADLNFSIFLPDGTKFPLVPGGEDIPVTLGNWRYYVELAERYRLKANADVFKALREGLACVLPIELLPLFTASELEQLVSGNRVVDVNMLRQCTEYENISPDSDTVKNFWSVLEEMTDDERTLFLRFVWARSRMPTSAQDSSMNFKLLGAQGAAKDDPDRYLPHAQTCFFSLSLPSYSTKEIMRNKLIYAINNSPNMDADVRLHNADGWTE